MRISAWCLCTKRASVALGLWFALPFFNSSLMAQVMPYLEVQYSSPSLIMNGVTTTSDGRHFVVIQPIKQGQPEVAEITSGAAVAYPDSNWNSWSAGDGGHTKFVGVNSLRIGPDGALWVVDRGAPGIGRALVAGGPKLVKIDVASNKIAKVYDLGPVAHGKSFVDDVRFNGRHAYLTDAGRPAIIVLDLDTGRARRVLENHPSTIANRPLMGEGKQLVDPDGKPIVVNADQLEVSPDGRWFFYQPCSGSMSRIETRYLDDPSVSPEDLASHVESFADTPSTGGTAIDADGVIYLSDTNQSRILKIGADGSISTLIADTRLAWVDAMWIDDAGKLWMPAAQINRLSGLNHGVDAVRWPVTIYSLSLDASPVRR